MANNIILRQGKEKALLTLFNSDNFGYVAIGYSQDGTINDPDLVDAVTGVPLPFGFTEISSTEEPTYIERLSLLPTGKIDYNPQTNKVSVEFQADLDIDVVTSGSKINQLAITDNQTPNAADSTYYAAASFRDLDKNENIALSFIIEIRL